MDTLYRKYRPRTFDGVVGQSHITETLKNQIAAGRIGHAYLFCGSRGVGKTSLARIFARAINCRGTEGAVPCGSCESCGQGESLDIIEIDAASNNGVDDARDLRDKVKYPPILGKYKVYIIDEAHMLTGSAFNALLKTLEEPPAHAVFILATTEPHKLPATILSRCMRFDFHLVGMRELFALIAGIFDKEGKKYQDEAVRAIAAAAEGSCRDALSIADTCMSLSGGELTLAEVEAVLGGDRRQTESLFAAIAAADISAAFTLVDGLYDSGKSMGVIARDLGRYARDLMVAKAAPVVLKTTVERQQHLISTAAEYSVEGLAALVGIFCEAESSLRYSGSRVAFESLIIKAVRLYSLDLGAFDQRILRLERRLDELALSGVSPATSAAPKTVSQASSANTNSANHNQGATKPANSADFEHSSTNIVSKNSADIDRFDSDSGLIPPPEFLDNIPQQPVNNGRKTAAPNGETVAKNASASSATPIKSADKKANDSAGISTNHSVANNSTINNSAATGAASNPKSDAPRLTPVQIWGRAITYFRRNSTPALTQVVGRHNPQRLRLTADTLTIFASREDYLIMCDPLFVDTLKNAVTAEGQSYRIVVEKDSQDVDLEREVTAMQAEFGKAKVNIIT